MTEDGKNCTKNEKASDMAVPVQVQSSAADRTDADEGNMPLLAHLEELRHRIIYAFIAIAIGSGIAYYFLDDIMKFLTQPVGKVYYMQPAEAFFTYIKVDLFAGFLLALPVLFFEVWRFFLPALTRKERRVMGIIVPLSVIMFFLGIAFAFAFVLPAGIRFFLGLGTAEMEALFSIEKYFDFVIAFVLPFGFIFELPLVIIILAKMGIITSAYLAKKQKIVLFMAFVIAAVISPTPDVVSQTMIAVPMLLLYEIGYGVVRFIMRR
jgi:sec-independent protein translocase protein TatC